MGTDPPEAAQAFGRAFAAGAGAADILRERGVLTLISLRTGIDDLTKLTLPEFRKTLLTAMRDPAGPIAGAAVRIGETWTGQLSFAADAVFKLQQTIFEAGFGDLAKTMIQEFTAVADSIRTAFTPDVINIFASAIGTFIPTAEVMLAVFGAIMNTAVTSFGLLNTAITDIRVKWNAFTGDAEELWELMQENPLGDLGKALLDVNAALGSAEKSLAAWREEQEASNEAAEAAVSIFGRQADLGEELILLSKNQALSAENRAAAEKLAIMGTVMEQESALQTLRAILGATEGEWARLDAMQEARAEATKKRRIAEEASIETLMFAEENLTAILMNQIDATDAEYQAALQLQAQIDRTTFSTENFGNQILMQIGTLPTLLEFSASAFVSWSEAIGDAFADALFAEESFAEAFPKLLKQAIADSLKSLAREAAVNAILEAAKGFARLAVGDVAGAGLHFKSAATYLAAAAAAGVAAKALAAGSESRTGGGGGGRGGRGGGGGGGGGGRGRDRGPVRADRPGEPIKTGPDITVVFPDSTVMVGNEDEIARKVQDLVKEAQKGSAQGPG